jgi:site-specific DNA-methyltransferase (adenine-specific)
MLSYNNIYFTDCFEGLSQIENKTIDLILTDPPYGTTQCEWDSVVSLENMWKEYKRVIKDNGVFVFTASQPFTSSLIMSNIEMFKQEIIWKKNIASNFLNANKMHLLIHEDICIFYDKQPTFNKQMLKGLPYIIKRNGKDDTGDCYGNIQKRTDTFNSGERNPVSILEFNREVGLHPTQKPVDLFSYLIKTYSNENNLILDTFSGSGTTAIACLETKRNYICFENNEEYYEKSIERVKQWHEDQKTIFDTV